MWTTAGKSFPRTLELPGNPVVLTWGNTNNKDGDGVDCFFSTIYLGNIIANLVVQDKYPFNDTVNIQQENCNTKMVIDQVSDKDSHFINNRFKNIVYPVRHFFRCVHIVKKNYILVLTYLQRQMAAKANSYLALL